MISIIYESYLAEAMLFSQVGHSVRSFREALEDIYPPCD